MYIYIYTHIHINARSSSSYAGYAKNARNMNIESTDNVNYGT